MTSTSHLQLVSSQVTTLLVNWQSGEKNKKKNHRYRENKIKIKKKLWIFFENQLE